MFKKSVAVALCLSTALNSLGFAMEKQPLDKLLNSSDTGVPHSSTTSPNSVSPNFSAFMQIHSPTNNLNTRNVGEEASRAVVNGTVQGLRQYCEGVRDTARDLLSGNFFGATDQVLQRLLQERYNTALQAYQSKNDSTAAKGEMDIETLGRFMGDVRQNTLMLLQRTGMFGNARIVYIPDRGVTETHYDIDPSTCRTFLNALLPNALPLKSLLMKLVGVGPLDKFIMGRIDRLFARLCASYYSHLTGRTIQNDLNRLATHGAGLMLLSGPMTGAALANYLREDYDDATSLAQLTTSGTEKSSSAIWELIAPQLTHYIREGFVNTLGAAAALSTEQLSEPLMNRLYGFVMNNPVVHYGVATGVGGLVDLVLPTPAIVDYPIGIIAVDALRRSLPRGLHDGRQIVIDALNQQLLQTIRYYSFVAMRLSPAEHQIYGLNPNPSADERALFHLDYEAQDQLRRQGLLNAAILDLYRSGSFVASLGAGLLDLIPESLRNLIQHGGGNGSSSSVALLEAADNEASGSGPVSADNQDNSRNRDTQAQVRLYRIAEQVGNHDQRVREFREDPSLFGSALRALNYVYRQVPPLELSAEDRVFFDNVRNYPSFENRQQELELLTRYMGWLSQSDQVKLRDYLSSQGKLSDDFVAEARAFNELLRQAPQNFWTQFFNNNRISDQNRPSKDAVIGAINLLQQQLSFQDYKLALEAMGNRAFVQRFLDTIVGDLANENNRTPDGFARLLRSIPSAYLTFSEYADLHENHANVVRLVQTSSLGVGLSARDQMALASNMVESMRVNPELSRSFSVAHQERLRAPVAHVIQAQTAVEVVIANDLAPMRDLYAQMVQEFQIQTYALNFIEGYGREAMLTDLIKKVYTAGENVDAKTLARRCIENALVKDPDFERFRGDLRRQLSNLDQRDRVYGLIKAEIFFLCQEFLSAQSSAPSGVGGPAGSAQPSASTNASGSSSSFWSSWLSRSENVPASSSSPNTVAGETLVPPTGSHNIQLSSFESLNRVDTTVSLGFGAFHVSNVMERMLAEDSTVFEGRHLLRLNDADLTKILTRLHKERMSSVWTFEDMEILANHMDELYRIKREDPALRNEVVFTYRDLLNELTRRNEELTRSLVVPKADTPGNAVDKPGQAGEE